MCSSNYHFDFETKLNQLLQDIFAGLAFKVKKKHFNNFLTAKKEIFLQAS